MTTRGTVGLLAVFVAFALYLLVVAPPSTDSVAVEDPLLTVPTERVVSIDVAWPDRHLRATRTDGVWRRDGGTALPTGAVDDLLAALATLRPTTNLTPGAAVTSDYGLGSGSTSLAVSAGDASVLALQIGDRNPAWTGVYVRRSGSDEISLVGALLHWELEKLHAMASD